MIRQDTQQETPKKGCKSQLITKTLLKIVVPQRIPDAYLIELTERLAEHAKNGTLKGLCFFTDYGESYMLGMGGSYLEDPASAVLPMKRLERRVMDQIDRDDPPLDH